MGLGFESQQDHASNLGAGFLRFTKENPRLFVLLQFALLTESQVSFIYQRMQIIRYVGGAFHKIVLLLQCGMSEGGKAPAYCPQNGRPRWTSVGFFLQDSQSLDYLGQILAWIDDFGIVGGVLWTVRQGQFYLHAVVVGIRGLSERYFFETRTGRTVKPWLRM